MTRIKYTKLKNIVIFSIIGLIVLASAGYILLHPDNHSSMSQWVKNNFFPANEYGTASVLDNGASLDQVDYTGSTTSAWVLCGMISMILGFIFSYVFAKERGII